MGAEFGILDWVCGGVRLILIVSFLYFLYLAIRFWKVLDTTRSETLHHRARKASNPGDPTQSLP